MSTVYPTWRPSDLSWRRLSQGNARVHVSLARHIGEDSDRGRRHRWQHVAIEFQIGGDLKFVTGLLGMPGNQTVNPFALCHVEDSKERREMHFRNKNELDAGGEDARTIDTIQKLAHVHIGEDYECPRCKVDITEGIEYPDRSTYHRRAYQREHLMVVKGKGPFFFSFSQCQGY